MGGADIRVPEGLNVEFTDFAFMGGNGSDLGDERPDPGGPTLRLRVISIMGGTDVKRGRKLTRAERKAQKHLDHGQLRTAGRSSARGTSSAVIGPIASRSVVPGGRSPRPVRGSRGGTGSPNSLWPCSAAYTRSARPASGRPSRQPAAISCEPCHSSQRQRRNGIRPAAADTGCKRTRGRGQSARALQR